MQADDRTKEERTPLVNCKLTHSSTCAANYVYSSMVDQSRLHEYYQRPLTIQYTGQQYLILLNDLLRLDNHKYVSNTNTTGL